MGTECGKWEWLAMVASERGPREATTRLVLHTLALHMQQDGSNAWPSQATLAMRTRLSERAVQKHLDIAKKAGWIAVSSKWPKGHGWKLHKYQATVPTGLELDVPAHPWEEDPTWVRPERGSGRSSIAPASTRVTALPSVTQRPAPDAKRPERDDTTSGTSRQNVLNDVRTNYPINYPMNNPEEGALASKHTMLPFGMKTIKGEGERGLPKDTEALKGQLAKAIKVYLDMGDAKLAQMYQTDLPTVQAARRATR